MNKLFNWIKKIRSAKCIAFLTFESFRVQVNLLFFHVSLEKITCPFCSIIKIHYTELALAILGKLVFAANI